jgi:hypothetical protein
MWRCTKLATNKHGDGSWIEANDPMLQLTYITLNKYLVTNIITNVIVCN